MEQEQNEEVDDDEDDLFGDENDNELVDGPLIVVDDKEAEDSEASEQLQELREDLEVIGSNVEP